jgi:tetratricopeptide (TPR) repeat protein
MVKRLPVYDDAEEALFEAQDLMYDAFEESDAGRRRALAVEALTISPDCADAYLLLAEETPLEIEQKLELLEAGVAAGERALGAETFVHDVGSFWLAFETRPYMRVRAALAETLWELERHDEAVGHMRELLRLNPNDNQGNRDVLVEWLLFLERWDELDELFETYEEDRAAVMVYTRALAGFCRHGESEEAERLLVAAIECNALVPQYLTGLKPLLKRLPDAYSIGDRREALLYASESKPLWKRVPGALAWLD